MTRPALTLTRTTEADLPLLFVFQTDKEGQRLAAFMPKDAGNREAWLEKHTKFLSDPNIHNCTIRLNGEIVGSIAKFVMEGEAELTYWIDRKHWGKGLASEALSAFLQIERTRPIHGRVAFDNYGSQRVLEKAGFVRIGSDRGFAHARGEEIEEYIYQLTEG